MTALALGALLLLGTACSGGGSGGSGSAAGDAKAPAGSKVWIVRHTLSEVGSVIRFLRRPAVSLLLTRVVPILLVGSVLFSIWRTPRRTPNPTPNVPDEAA